MTDAEIKKLFKIPTQTLHQWKNSDKDDWRIRFYKYFSLKDYEEVAPEIERVNKILESKKKAS